MLSCFTQTFSERSTVPSKRISYTVGDYSQKGFAISLYIKDCSQIPQTEGTKCFDEKMLPLFPCRFLSKNGTSILKGLCFL